MALRHSLEAMHCASFLNFFFFLDTLIHKIHIVDNEKELFRGELTDVSAKKEALVMHTRKHSHVDTSVAVLAEISFGSPRKMFIFIIRTNINRIKGSKKRNKLNFENNLTC